MSGDGAHRGVSADRALGTILGGDPPPSDDEGMDPQQMQEWLLSARAEDSRNDYGEAARYAAKLILEYLLADPRRALIPAENVYETTDKGLVFNDEGDLNLVTPGLYEVMKSDGVTLDDLGLTGFQWGWAVNAARRCVELGPVPNPALVTVNSPEPTT